jgi:glycosyltransferase involved in cell wall biosynthesis
MKILKKFLEKKQLSYEIIVVNDASKDNTYEFLIY